MKIFCKTVTLFSSGFEHLLSSKLSRDWIVPAWIPRMTATDALKSEPETPGNPEAIHRFNHILATTRMKTADPTTGEKAKQTTLARHETLIEAYRSD